MRKMGAPLYRYRQSLNEIPNQATVSIQNEHVLNAPLGMWLAVSTMDKILPRLSVPFRLSVGMEEVLPEFSTDESGFTNKSNQAGWRRMNCHPIYAPNALAR